MHKKTIITFSLAICLLYCLPEQATATSTIRTAWRNYYNPCTTLYNASCAICHVSTSNPVTFNPYGSDLQNRIANQGMSNNAAFRDVESIDSDGDGYTNGQEIVLDCTYPGEAASRGTVADEVSTWGQIKTLYR